MTPLLLVLSAFLAALIGFSAHRAGICTVKAVAEIMTTGHAHMLISFGKAAVWVFALSAPLVWLVPGLEPLPGALPGALSLAAGVVFGIGTVINGGCAISTVTRLGGGDLGMTLTLAGLALGVAPWAGDPGWRPPAQPSPLTGAPPAAVALAVLTALWAAWEAVCLWRSRDRGLSLRTALLAHRWRLSTAAAVIGITNAALCALHGGWAYSGLIHDGVDWLRGGGAMPSPATALLFATLIAGVTASAVLRRTFRLRWRPTARWLHHFAGGLLMGTGIALIPGGNASLILHGIPSLSLHAVPAYAALVLGVAGALAAKRWWQGQMAPVDCSGDVCHSP